MMQAGISMLCPYFFNSLRGILPSPVYSRTYEEKGGRHCGGCAAGPRPANEAGRCDGAIPDGVHPSAAVHHLPFSLFKKTDTVEDLTQEIFKIYFFVS